MVDAGDLRIPEHCSSGFESQHRTMRIFPYGKPFSVTGLRNWFRDLCNAAGLPHCSAHGIRKFEATHAAEAGVTEHQLMGMFGGDDPKQAADVHAEGTTAETAMVPPVGLEPTLP